MADRMVERSEGERPRLKLVRWRKAQRGFVVGFADVELPIGLRIADIMVIAKDGKAWVNLPGKPRLVTVDGKRQPAVGADGKPIYDPVLSWRSQALAEAFSERVIEMVRASMRPICRRGLWPVQRGARWNEFSCARGSCAPNRPKLMLRCNRCVWRLCHIMTGGVSGVSCNLSSEDVDNVDENDN
jgi:hypothetical protein